MTTIANYLKQAELALASYAVLDVGAPAAAVLVEEGMETLQAQRFSEQWGVVAQYSHSEQSPIYDDGGNITGYLTTSNGLSQQCFRKLRVARDTWRFAVPMISPIW